MIFYKIVILRLQQFFMYFMKHLHFLIYLKVAKKNNF